MRTAAVIVACVFLAGAASPASALVLYGVSYDEQIWTIDRTTGAVDLYMDTPGMRWFGATDGPTSSSFFATQDGGSLYRVDVLADTLTPIGDYGGGINLRSLAYAEPDSATGTGVLYGSDYEKLYTINIGTGVATEVGPITPAADLFVGVWSMDYDPVAKAIFITNLVNNPVGGLMTKLYTIDPISAATTLIGEFPNALPIADIWYDHDSGKMLGVTNVTGQLYEIDTTNAQVTPIGTAPGENILGLGGAIPEPAAGLLFLLASGLLGRTIRRRR